MLRFPLSKSSKADTPPAAAAKSGPAKSTEAHPLDGLTGGAFSAATSGERASRIRLWLGTEPTYEQMAEVYKDLANRDKGAAKPLKEKLDEAKRSRGQEVVAAEWAEKAQSLLALPKLNLANALAWQRDAAKAGAPLSKEPLTSLKTQLAERVRGIEDLQHRVQVQREASCWLSGMRFKAPWPWRSKLLKTRLRRCRPCRSGLTSCAVRAACRRSSLRPALRAACRPRVRQKRKWTRLR